MNELSDLTRHAPELISRHLKIYECQLGVSWPVMGVKVVNTFSLYIQIFSTLTESIILHIKSLWVSKYEIFGWDNPTPQMLTYQISAVCVQQFYRERKWNFV